MRLAAAIFALLAILAMGVQGAPAGSKQAVPANDPLAGLQPSESQLPPGLSNLNLTQLAPLLPLISQLNSSVVASWVPVIEKIDPTALEAWVPVVNQLDAEAVEAVAAALPSVSVVKVLDLLPAINALPAATLEGYIKVLGKVDYKLVESLLPSIAILDPVWVNKVVPAVAEVDADYLVKLVRAIAPDLVKINPDQLVALVPAFSTLSVSTWKKLIELVGALTVEQLQLLVHLLDVTGPYFDSMTRVLNLIRAASPIDITTYMGKTTVFTKDKGTTGMGNNSVVIAQKQHPTSEPNNGAPPAAPAPAVPTTPVPKTLGNATSSGRRLSSVRRSLLHFWY